MNNCFFFRAVFPFMLADFFRLIRILPSCSASTYKLFSCFVCLETFIVCRLVGDYFRSYQLNKSTFEKVVTWRDQFSAFDVTRVSRNETNCIRPAKYFSMWCMSFNFNSVADPGFPRWEIGCNPLCLVRKPVILQDFCQKLHENEKIWPRGNL